MGIISGIILPLIVIFLFYMIKSDLVSFSSFVNHIVKYNIHSEIVSLCVVPNLLLFFLFIWKNYNLSAKGVILATMLYGIFIIILKYV